MATTKKKKKKPVETPDVQIREEILRKSEVLRKGLREEFWQILEELLEAEVEYARDTLEEPSITFGDQRVPNQGSYLQYTRAVIKVIRRLLEAPASLVETGKFVSKVLADLKTAEDEGE